MDSTIESPPKKPKEPSARGNVAVESSSAPPRVYSYRLGGASKYGEAWGSRAKKVLRAAGISSINYCREYLFEESEADLLLRKPDSEVFLT